MIGSLWNGISGLNSFQQALQTESNNVTNVNTVGFKSDSVAFEDMMYSSAGVGGGTGLTTVTKSFEQGSISQTGNSLDVAINGDGFFIVGSGEETYYTRAGNFKMGSDGVLQTTAGDSVFGLTLSGSNEVVTTDENVTTMQSDYSTYLASQSITTDNKVLTVNSRATDYTDTVDNMVSQYKADGLYPDGSAYVSGNNYKNASAILSDITALSNEYRSALADYAYNSNLDESSPTYQLNSFSLDPTKLENAGDAITLNVGGVEYKVSMSDGETPEETINKFADKLASIGGFDATATLNEETGSYDIEMKYLMAGNKINVNNAYINEAGMNVTTQFEDYSTGEVSDTFNAGSGLLSVAAVRDQLEKSIGLAGGEFIEITSTIDNSVAGVANLNGIQLKLDSLGVVSGDSQSSVALADEVEIAEDGSVYVTKDGNKYIAGMVKIARFNDNNGLEALGGNLFGKTIASGEPLDAMNSSTSLTSGSLELSNSNLSTGLTNLMVFQRAFEANSKTITTSDDFLNIAIQLKK